MLKNKDPTNKLVTTVTALPGQGPKRQVKVSFTDAHVIGNGSFGMVYQARLLPSEEIVAIKKVVQNKCYKNRELKIMRELNHCNITKLKYFYFCNGEKDQEYLCLILEYFPETLHSVLRAHDREKRSIPSLYVKLYMYQLFRSLAYLHSLGISHRDVKPQNLLLNSETGVLKLCDFGSAKHLVKGETNVFYICSRYYRAPELLFYATEYTTAVDVWSAGCVLAELILGHPIFHSDDSLNQLVEIMKVLGTPSKGEIRQMNKAFAENYYPHLDPTPWQKVFKGKETSIEAIDLVPRLLVYTPSVRITPLQACAHKFFNKLREPGVKLLNKRELPPLFNFTERELNIQPNLNSILIPSHLRKNFCPANEDYGYMIAEKPYSTTDNNFASYSQNISVTL